MTPELSVMAAAVPSSSIMDCLGPKMRRQLVDSLSRAESLEDLPKWQQTVIQAVNKDIAANETTTNTDKIIDGVTTNDDTEVLAHSFFVSMNSLLEEGADAIEAGETDLLQLMPGLDQYIEGEWDESREEWEAQILDAYVSGLAAGYDEVGAGEITRQDFLDDVTTNARGKSKVKVPPRDAWGSFMSARANELSERLAAGWKTAAGVVSQEIAKVVVNGLNAGESARTIANNIRALSSGIPKARAMAIAVTESTRAFAEGQLDAYTRLRISQVTSNMGYELETQGKNICPECHALSKLPPMPLERARGMIPVHPNCKCRWKMVKNVLTNEEPTDNIFCKTGQGGGIDPSCKLGSGTSQSSSAGVTQFLDTLPPKVRGLVRAHVSSIFVHSSSREAALASWPAVEQAYRDHVGIKPGKSPTPKQRKQMEDYEDQWLAQPTLGGYHGPTGRLDLVEKGPTSMTQVLAHEVGHVIDFSRPGGNHSEQNQFNRAYTAEILVGKAAGKPPRLSEYARTNPKEGFAEFARLVYGKTKPLSEVEKEYPLTSQYFKEQGLWPL